MRDQDGTAIRHALYRPVCTCGWRGFSGCVVHPSLSERADGIATRQDNESPKSRYDLAQGRGNVLIKSRDARSESDEQEPRHG